jgi:polyisoprenoid-binding protein YceI
MSRRSWLIAIPVAVLLVAVVGPWLYINVISDDPPERLTLDDATTTTAGSATDASSTTSAAPSSVPEGIEGTWSITAGSQAGYRAKEVLFGQDAEAVGRTSTVTGTMTIEGTTVTATEVEVDMTTVASDESRRDGQFRNRIMDTATFPTATFSLSEPIELGAVPGDGEQLTRTVTGELTLRGVTQSVTFELTARRNGATIEANGIIPIDFDDYEIPDASGGPATVGRNGEVELLLVFAR